MKQPTTASRAAWMVLCVALVVLAVCCSKAEKPQPEAQAKQAVQAPEQPAASAATPAKSAEEPPPAAAAPVAPAPEKPKPTATPASKVAEPPPAPAPAGEKPAAKPPVTETPTPPVAATPPAASPAVSEHASVGSERCKMCHKIQYDSWAPSKHARATPPVGCETCHGNGADYLSMSVMKDPAKAKQGGLIMPGTEFCNAKCHKASAITPDMLSKAHAHKVG